MTTASSSVVLERADRRDATRVLVSGAVVWTIDLAYACVLSAIARHQFVSPWRVLQGIAAGLLGRATFDYGATSMVLGAAIHYTIASTWSAIYLFAWRRLAALRRLAGTLRGTLVAGLVFGEVVWLVMRFVVMPLSRATPTPVHSWVFWTQVVCHPLLVGLPIALIVGRRGSVRLSR